MRHGGNDGVVFFGQQGRNDAVPILGHQFDFGPHGGAQGLGDVDVETGQFAVRCHIAEGRVGPFHPDADFLPVLGLNGSGGQNQSDNRNHDE